MSFTKCFHILYIPEGGGRQGAPRRNLSEGQHRAHSRTWRSHLPIGHYWSLTSLLGSIRFLTSFPSSALASSRPWPWAVGDRTDGGQLSGAGLRGSSPFKIPLFFLLLLLLLLLGSIERWETRHK